MCPVGIITPICGGGAMFGIVLFCTFTFGTFPSLAFGIGRMFGLGIFGEFGPALADGRPAKHKPARIVVAQRTTRSMGASNGCARAHGMDAPTIGRRISR
jgi:hypothetical protein